MEIERDQLLRRLTQMQYARNNMDFRRGTFRVRGDVIEVFPAYEEDRVIRVELFGSISSRVRSTKLGATTGTPVGPRNTRLLTTSSMSPS